MLTTVVGDRQDGGEVALAVLGDDAEARHGAASAGDVERRVAAVVGQQWVSAGFQETVHQLGLLGDHCQVEGSLRKRTQLFRRCMRLKVRHM